MNTHPCTHTHAEIWPVGSRVVRGRSSQSVGPTIMEPGCRLLLLLLFNCQLIAECVLGRMHKVFTKSEPLAESQSGTG